MLPLATTFIKHTTRARVAISCSGGMLFISGGLDKKILVAFATRIFWLGHRDSNPGNDGVRVRCLTAWRCPNISLTKRIIADFFRLVNRYLQKNPKLFAVFPKNRFTFGIEYGIIFKYPPLAQLDRVSDSDSEGHRFESCRAGQKIRLVLTSRIFLSIAKQWYIIDARSAAYIISPKGAVYHHAPACISASQ